MDILKGNRNCVMSVAFSPDNSKIVSGSWDKTIRLPPIYPRGVDLINAFIPR